MHDLPDVVRALVRHVQTRGRSMLVPASALAVALASILLVPVAHSQTPPPAGCISNTGGACVTLCSDGTWSSSSGSGSCSSHGGIAPPPPSGSPPPTGTQPSPSSIFPPAPTPQPNPGFVPSPGSGPTVIGVPPAAVAASVPEPSPATFASTGSPPQNVFYVSPEGCDPAPAPAANCGSFPAASLLCTSTNPCKTINFALSQARDGDAIDLAGGTYPIPAQIEVNKLITIQPSTNTTSQLSSTQVNTCTTAPTTGFFACTFTISATVLSGSSVTFTASGNSPVITNLQVNAVGATPCTGGPTSPAGATATLDCGPGQSLPSGAQVIVTVQMLASATVQFPTVTMTVNAPTLSNRPVLQSTNGAPIFHVTAVGSPDLHVIIFGLTMGDATSLNQSAAIVLDNDSYTEISHNVIGSQDLPDAIGILLTASDHPVIHDNTIQGSTLFPRTTSIEVGVPGGGFGVVTDECLGSVNHSNGVQLINNLFAKNSNAGIWFCSDGTGGFLINGNSIRANGRGIVLNDAVDTVISSNTIGDNVLDGIDLFSSSERNQITGNTIESQQGNTSIGILLAGQDANFPLGNQIASNQIRRNTVDVAIVGAQGTQIQTNSVTAVGTNTGVLFALALPGWSSGQPLNTLLSGNALESSGSCTATNGCAIRLTAGVTTPIDATGGNAWGTGDPGQIQAQIWDHGKDPALGTVYVLSPVPPATASGILGLPPTPAPGVIPQPIVPASAPVPIPAPFPLATPNTAPVPIGTPAAPAPAGGSAGTAQSGLASAYQEPGTGNYYVPLLFCISGGTGPVANDQLTLAFLDNTGATLGITHVTADGSGCFNGNVAPDIGTSTLPAQIIVTDETGTRYTFKLAAGSPLQRPPAGPIQ